MPDRDQYHLLIVDDDDVIRESLISYLVEYHEADYALHVDTSPNPLEARKKLAAQPYDLVITDINMPGEDGFVFIQSVRKQYPKTKTAMITAYKVEDYIRNAQKTGVFNLITKTAPFNFEELSTVINNLLNPTSAFGLHHYMTPASPFVHNCIRCGDDIMQAFQTLQHWLEENWIPNANDLLTAVIEALTNAVYHAAKHPDGSLKYQKGQWIAQLEEDEYVNLYFGRDAERIGIAIADQGGRITADEILYWLERNISGKGVVDTHGRGVYLIHCLVDRVLINILPGECTEIIMLNYLNSIRSENKPIYINQL